MHALQLPHAPEHIHLPHMTCQTYLEAIQLGLYCTLQEHRVDVAIPRHHHLHNSPAGRQRLIRQAKTMEPI